MGKKSNLSLQVYVGHPEVCWHKPESPNIGRFLLQVYAVGGRGQQTDVAMGLGGEHRENLWEPLREIKVM